KRVVYGKDLRIGAKVCRGPDWRWGDQDGRGIGEVVRNVADLTGVVRVKWANGETNHYRAGAQNSYDLL
ncbi:hypothetical protein KIPB_016102, partial [Kipferlia bialata]